MSKPRQVLMLLLSCLVLFISSVAPYYTSVSNLSNSIFKKSSSLHYTNVDQSVVDLEDEENLISSDDADFFSDAQIHYYSFIILHPITLTFPCFKVTFSSNHFSDLMVPPPQRWS